MAKLDGVIGFEYNSYEIRAVEMTKSSGGYSLVAYGKQPLESAVVEEGFIRDPEKFSDAFLTLMREKNFAAENVVFGVNNENVVMRYASFPKVPDDKLRNMIFLQAQEFMPIPVQEMQMDYIVAGESKDSNDQEMIDVVLVGARNTMLDQLINVFGAAKKTVIDVEPTPFALCRTASVVNPEKCYCMLNVSNGIINFLFVKGDAMQTVRSIAIPDKHFDAVQSIYRGDATEEQINEAANMLVSELNASISYYGVQHPMDPVDVVYFMADIANAKQISEMMQDSVSLPVEIPSFYASLGGAVDISAYTGCISMAIEALEG
jgi:type IV pilus assembly protein PilM